MTHLIPVAQQNIMRYIITLFRYCRADEYRCIDKNKFDAHLERRFIPTNVQKIIAAISFSNKREEIISSRFENNKHQWHTSDYCYRINFTLRNIKRHAMRIKIDEKILAENMRGCDDDVFRYWSHEMQRSFLSIYFLVTYTCYPWCRCVSFTTLIQAVGHSQYTSNSVLSACLNTDTNLALMN